MISHHAKMLWLVLQFWCIQIQDLKFVLKHTYMAIGAALEQQDGEAWQPLGTKFYITC